MTISFEKFGDELKYESFRVEVLTILRRSFTDITGVAMAGDFTIDSIDAQDGTTPSKGHAG